MNKEEIKFRIDQLRKDKIIYSVDAIAINTCAFIIIYVSQIYLKEQMKDLVVGLSFLGAVGFTIFAIVGNLFRFYFIGKLEKLLERK